MTRKEILDTALKCVNGERDEQYGNPEDNFKLIANLWMTYLNVCGSIPKGYEINIRPEDVAAMLALLKIARIATGKSKDDNWVDLAGYAACGGEIQGRTDRLDRLTQTVCEHNTQGHNFNCRCSTNDKIDELRKKLTISEKKLEIKEMEEKICGINLSEMANEKSKELAKSIKPPHYIDTGLCPIHTNPEDSMRYAESSLGY